MSNIPEAVRTRVALHLATTRHDLSLVRVRLAELPSLSAEGRRLRVRRDQLSRQEDAWAHIAASLEGGDPDVPDLP